MVNETARFMVPLLGMAKAPSPPYTDTCLGLFLGDATVDPPSE